MFFTLIPMPKNIKNGENYAYFGVEMLFLNFTNLKSPRLTQTKFQTIKIKNLKKAFPPQNKQNFRRS